MNLQDLQNLAATDALNAGISPQMFIAQISQESSWNPNAYNASSGATGLGQFIPSTAQMFNIDPTNPTQSLAAAANYDAQLIGQNGGNVVAALQQYGTLPANLGNLTSGQSNLLNIAQGLTGGADSGLLGNPSWNAGNQGAGLGAWITELGTRIALIALGGLLIVGGIFLLGMENERGKGGTSLIPIPV